MQVVNTRALEGTLAELFGEFGTHEDKSGVADIVVSLKGEDLSREFRVPAADTGHELFFNNRELLARFTSMTKPDQAAFLSCVRKAMNKHMTTMIHLTVPWTQKGTKVIKIIQIGREGAVGVFGQGPLNIYID